MSNKKYKSAKIALTAIVAALAVLVAGFFAWTRFARYPAFQDAVSVADSAKTARGWYVFEAQPVVADSTAGTARPSTGFIFYPGGLVDPRAYAPLMKRLADGGLTSIIIPMPLDLAVFNIDGANAVMAAYPGIDRWIIGGHSLGGSMAAEYAARYFKRSSQPQGTPPGQDAAPDQGALPEQGAPSARGARSLEGLVFLASYSAKSTDLSALPIRVLSIYGSNDGVLSSEFAASMKCVPPGSTLVEIQGGNHAQFGNYGPQEGDGQASISREAQQERTAELVLEFIRSIK